MGSIFLNFQHQVIRHLLTIWLMMNGDVTKAQTEQEEFEEYFHSNVYSKLSMHASLETFKFQNTVFEIDKIVIITSLFSNNLFLAVEIGGVNYSELPSAKPRLLIKTVTISRSRVHSTSKLRSHSIDSIQMQKQSILMQNNKPLILSR